MQSNELGTKEEEEEEEDICVGRKDGAAEKCEKYYLQMQRNLQIQTQTRMGRHAGTKSLRNQHKITYFKTELQQ